MCRLNMASLLEMTSFLSDSYIDLKENCIQYRRLHCSPTTVVELGKFGMHRPENLHCHFFWYAGSQAFVAWTRAFRSREAGLSGIVSLDPLVSGRLLFDTVGSLNCWDLLKSRGILPRKSMDVLVATDENTSVSFILYHRWILQYRRYLAKIRNGCQGTTQRNGMCWVDACLGKDIQL